LEVDKKKFNFEVKEGNGNLEDVDNGEVSFLRKWKGAKCKL
jgi:hypothetical protein